MGEQLERLRECVRAEMRAIEVECAQLMGDRFGNLAKDLPHFLTKKDKPLNVSLGELRVLAGGSAEAAKAVSIRLLVDSGTNAAVFTNPDASLPAGLPSVVSAVVDFAQVSSSHALAFHTATPVKIGVAEDFKTIVLRTSICTDSAENTMDSVLDLRPIVSTSVPADHPVSSAATPGKVPSKMKVVPSSKSSRPIHERRPHPCLVREH